MLTPKACVGCAVAGMTSAIGRCHTFDNRADGYVRAEACSSFVLRSFTEVSTGQSIGHVLCGSAVRSDGRSASLTAPNGQAQQALRLDARARAGTSVRQSAYAEYHGTGTILGDPIEAGSYAAVVQAVGGASDAIGSIKGNVGHSESGAGTSGLLTLTLHLKRLRASSNVQLRVANRRVNTALDQVLSVLPVQQAQLTLASGSM
jgi:acyl transferase domain-containing protein